MSGAIERTSRGGGVGAGGVLLIVFVVLKLTGNVGWSWWWVLSPLWVGAAIVSLSALIYVVVVEGG